MKFDITNLLLCPLIPSFHLKPSFGLIRLTKNSWFNQLSKILFRERRISRGRKERDDKLGDKHFFGGESFKFVDLHWSHSQPTFINPRLLGILALKLSAPSLSSLLHEPRDAHKRRVCLAPLLILTRSMTLLWTLERNLGSHRQSKGYREIIQ
ncbi:hypothetical protein CUMW_256830 [Citrus unshiu]|uniref:Uncharacterized protein n=1 Tax=Citrus unshiu TaxID=55188 RepID=A0A2H5QS79_CITUN|nr:hypothetical protein CUMW_256830 [Citrus unshiu]